MKPIRNDAVILGECDSFEDVCKHVNDLYDIIRDQQKAIVMLIERLTAKTKKKKVTKKK